MTTTMQLTTATAPREFSRELVKHYDSVFGYAMNRTRDRQDAADIAQDTMFKALRYWTTFQPGTCMKSWLFTIARNTFIDVYNRRQRAVKQASSVSSETSVAAAAAIGYSQSSMLPTGDEALEARATREDLDQALASLPADYREALEAVDVQGLSYRQAADQIGCPIGTVMSRVYRARTLLHSSLYDTARARGLVSDQVRPGERITRYTRIRPKPAAEQLSLMYW